MNTDGSNAFVLASDFTDQSRLETKQIRTMEIGGGRKKHYKPTSASKIGNLELSFAVAFGLIKNEKNENHGIEVYKELKQPPLGYSVTTGGIEALCGPQGGCAVDVPSHTPAGRLPR